MKTKSHLESCEEYDALTFNLLEAPKSAIFTSSLASIKTLAPTYVPTITVGLESFHKAKVDCVCYYKVYVCTAKRETLVGGNVGEFGESSMICQTKTIQIST